MTENRKTKTRVPAGNMPPELHERKQRIREAAARLAVLTPPRAATADELAQAEEIVAGNIRFNAHQPPEIPRTLFTVGRRDIDWSGGHLKHQEWPTQMGRFFMLGPLMAAFRETGDTRFAEAARDYIDDWISHFDAEDITLRGNTCMDIGIRIGTHGFGGWASALALFMDTPAWGDAFVARMLDSLERQAHILWKRGIPSRSWGNHRIFGLDGLLHVCLRLPFLKDAEDMLDTARTGLEYAVEHQFLADGAHIEQTLGYHQHMTATFVYLHRLGQAFPEAALKLPLDRLVRAADYYLHTLPAGINDTQALPRDQPEPGAWQAARVWREQLAGRGAEPDWRPDRDAIFPSAGQVFARSAWEPGADFLAFDAGPYAGSHAHLARLGLVFRSGGRLWLADPGMFDYEMSNPFAIYGRSTAAHCTLNLDGLNQAPADARLVRAVVRDDLVLLHGVYSGGYWNGVYKWGFQDGVGQGVYGRHERIVLWIRGEYLLVFDAIMGDSGHTVESVWQLAPVPAWSHDPATLAWRSEGEAVNFHLQMVLPPPAVRMEVAEGRKDPLRGWFCDAYSTGFTPAPQIVFRYPSKPVFYGVLAMPLAGGKQPPAVRSMPAGAGRGLELAWPDGRRDQVALSASLCVPLDENSPFETDSPLVWLRLDRDGQPVRQVMLDGTFLRYRGATP